MWGCKLMKLLCENLYMKIIHIDLSLIIEFKNTLE